jgi:hypothetical protein
LKHLSNHLSGSLNFQVKSKAHLHRQCTLYACVEALQNFRKKAGKIIEEDPGGAEKSGRFGHARPSIGRKSLPREPKMKRQSKKAFGCMNAEPASFPGLIGDRRQTTWTNPPFAQVFD